MNAAERLAELEAAIGHARDACEDTVVVVEGRSDLDALNTLGIGGAHRQVGGRGSMEDLVMALAGEGRRVVILVDWDRTGGRLARRLHAGLVGQVPVDMEVRRRLATACKCKCVEHVPGELNGLRLEADPRR